MTTRLVIVLLILVGLTLVALQNLSPLLSLTFLGMKTVALPLAAWIIAAIAAGFLTSLILSLLFQLSNYLAEKELRTTRKTLRDAQLRIRQLEAVRSDASWQRSDTVASSYKTAEEEPASDDDFEDEEEEEPIDDTPSYQDTFRERTTYERYQEPKTSYQSGSVYSYGYRDPSNSGVGKTESIYDADYRVINPPRQETKKTESDWGQKNNTDDEDWGFDDDDADDKKPRRW